MTNTPSTPSIPAIAWEYTFPLRLLFQLFLRGLLPTLQYMLFHPTSIPFPTAWRKSFLNAGQPALLAEADVMYADIKRQLIGQARGRVLEVGAGTGETVKYYRKGQVDVVYGVEPNVDALGDLRKQLVKHDLVEKYEILPFGVEDEARMKEAGVEPGSIDTIVCVSALIERVGG